MFIIFTHDTDEELELVTEVNVDVKNGKRSADKRKNEEIIMFLIILLSCLLSVVSTKRRSVVGNNSKIEYMNGIPKV